MLLSTTLLALPVALFQTVLVVDDDGGVGVDHTNIQTAINAAPAGSVINIRDGQYGAATIDGKPLMVTTEATGSVVLQGGLVIRNLPPGEVVTVRGIGIVNINGDDPLTLEQNEGICWLENCLVLMDQESQDQGAYIVDSNEVVMRVCTFAPTGGLNNAQTLGIRAERSNLHLYNVVSVGSDNAFAPGSPGIELLDSFLYASDCEFTGGSGGIACPTSCFPQPGGAGVRIAGPGGSNANLTNAVLRGGNGGSLSGVFAPDGLPAQVILGNLAEESEPVRMLDIPNPIRSNEQAQISIKGEPGELVFALFSTTPAPLYLPGFFDSLLVAASPSSFFLATLDAQGSAMIQLDASLPPGTLARTLYTQMLHVNLPGPQLDLGPPTSVVILDAAL